ncbi:hypothetical protein ACQPZX_18615 [Actinoplanes sp. CA-142083]|uniref:hypothetical protein n=1 Tax=Actinoplanes sp. CA-142083 TaxID=3239903 RepID=UPI003D930F62
MAYLRRPSGPSAAVTSGWRHDVVDLASAPDRGLRPGLAAKLLFAFGVAFGAFLAARMPVALLARPAYATPLTTTEPVPVGGSTDQAGAANRAGTNVNQFLHARAIQQFEIYHPADRFWTFQLIEAALFVTVAAVLIGVVVWRVRRRTI